MTDTRFVLWTHTGETNAARCRILEDLMRFVFDGCVDPYKGAQHAKAKVFENDIKARLFDALQPSILKYKADGKTDGSTSAMLIAAFSTAERFTGLKLKVTPLIRDKAIETEFVKQFGCKPRVWRESEPTVEGAYSMARANYEVMTSRIITLNALLELVRESNHRNVEIPEGWHELRTTLFERRSEFLRNMLMFGGMLGGSAAAAAVHEAATTSCYKEDPDAIQYAVAHFMIPDGILPSRYDHDWAEALKTDIANCMKAL